MRTAFAPFLGAALLAMTAMTGCDSQPASSAAPVAAPQEATLEMGDTTVRASVVQTSALNEAIARQYGIERGDDIVMLLVGLREGPDAEETSVPASVTAGVTNLRGQKQVVEMRELRSGDLVDYVGTLQVSPPDTLVFELTIELEGGPASTMRFTREFFPR